MATLRAAAAAAAMLTAVSAFSSHSESFQKQSQVLRLTGTDFPVHLHLPPPPKQMFYLSQESSHLSQELCFWAQDARIQNKEATLHLAFFGQKLDPAQVLAAQAAASAESSSRSRSASSSSSPATASMPAASAVVSLLTGNADSEIVSSSSSSSPSPPGFDDKIALLGEIDVPLWTLTRKNRLERDNLEQAAAREHDQQHRSDDKNQSWNDGPVWMPIAGKFGNVGSVRLNVTRFEPTPHNERPSFHLSTYLSRIGLSVIDNQPEEMLFFLSLESPLNMKMDLHNKLYTRRYNEFSLDNQV